MDKTTFAIKLRPLDVLFFRDGRPFEAGFRGVSGVPTPQTLAGALRTRIMESVGVDFKEFGDALRRIDGICEAFRSITTAGWLADTVFRGPWLYAGPQSVRAGDGRQIKAGPLFASPSTLVRCMDRNDTPGPVSLMSPMPESATLPGWCGMEDCMRPLWVKDAHLWEGLPGFIDSAALSHISSGNINSLDDNILFSPADLFIWEDRTGISIDPGSSSVMEGQIYSTRFMRLREGISFYAEISVPADADIDPSRVFPPGCTIPWGGEGRRVAVEILDKPFSWPVADSEKSCWYMLTPGIFEPPSWRPSIAGGASLVSASVPKPVPFSGWDMVCNSPKPTRWAVPAGSMYFWNTPVEQSGSPLISCGNQDDCAAGWNIALACAWPTTKGASK